MTQDLIRRLGERQKDIVTIVNELFDTIPSEEPNIVFDETVRRIGDLVVEGHYNVDDRLITIYPAVIRTVSRTTRKIFNINPRNEIERIFAKEYAQHVHSSLFDFQLPEDIASIIETDRLLYGFVMGYQEACGMISKFRVAKQLNHHDGYERLFTGQMRDNLKLLAEHYKRRENANPTMTILALAYQMTEVANRLNLVSVKNWVRRNPLEADRQEVDNAYELFRNSVQQHF